ncbi:uncharacterized protein LOC136754734 isoform X2 [Amia ocellicauda]
MADDELARYIPYFGDRRATVAFCRQQNTSEDMTPRNHPLFERLSGKLCSPQNKGRQKVDRSRIGQGNSNAKRKDRRVEIGWMDYDEKTEEYRQVRAAKGGGTRHLRVDKSTKIEELRKIAQDIFFPDGSYKKWNIKDVNTEICDFGQQEAERDCTVEELYNSNNVKILRLYLCTKPPRSKPGDTVNVKTQGTNMDSLEENNTISYSVIAAAAAQKHSRGRLQTQMLEDNVAASVELDSGSDSSTAPDVQLEGSWTHMRKDLHDTDMWKTPVDHASPDTKSKAEVLGAHSGDPHSNEDVDMEASTEPKHTTVAKVITTAVHPAAIVQHKRTPCTARKTYYWTVENVSGTESEETLHGDSSAREAQERLPPAEPKQEAEETPQGPLLVLPPQGHPSYVEEFRVSETPRIVGPPFTSVPCSLPYTPSTQLPEQQHQQQSLDTGTVQVKKEPQPEFLYTPQPSDAVFKGLNFDEQDNNPHFISLGNQVGLLAHQIGKLTEQVGEMSRALVQKTSCEQFQMEQMTVNHNISATLSLLAKAVLSKDFSGSKPVTDCSTQTEFSN